MISLGIKNIWLIEQPCFSYEDFLCSYIDGLLDCRDLNNDFNNIDNLLKLHKDLTNVKTTISTVGFNDSIVDLLYKDISLIDPTFNNKDINRTIPAIENVLTDLITRIIDLTKLIIGKIQIYLIKVLDLQKMSLNILSTDIKRIKGLKNPVWNNFDYAIAGPKDPYIFINKKVVELNNIIYKILNMLKTNKWDGNDIEVIEFTKGNTLEKLRIITEEIVSVSCRSIEIKDAIKDANKLYTELESIYTVSIKFKEEFDSIKINTLAVDQSQQINPVDSINMVGRTISYIMKYNLSLIKMKIYLYRNIVEKT